jgi:uncharacterized membrane protein
VAEIRNPLGSEAAAFRFLIATAVYFGLIALGAVVSSWVGLATFLVLTIGVLWWLISRARRSSGDPGQSN